MPLHCTLYYSLCDIIGRNSIAVLCKVQQVEICVLLLRIHCVPILYLPHMSPPVSHQSPGDSYSIPKPWCQNCWYIAVCWHRDDQSPNSQSGGKTFVTVTMHQSIALRFYVSSVKISLYILLWNIPDKRPRGLLVSDIWPKSVGSVNNLYQS